MGHSGLSPHVPSLTHQLGSPWSPLSPPRPAPPGCSWATRPHWCTTLPAGCVARGWAEAGLGVPCANRSLPPPSPHSRQAGAELPKVGLCGSQGLSPPPGGGVLELHLGSPRRGASSSLGDLKRLGWVLLPTGSQTPTLRGSVCFKSQTPPQKIIKKVRQPKPQGGALGRSWSPPTAAPG